MEICALLVYDLDLEAERCYNHGNASPVQAVTLLSAFI